MENSAKPLNGLNESALAERWGMSRSTLQNWRNLGKGPAFLKIGNKVIYPVDDIVSFESANKRTSTSATAA